MQTSVPIAVLAIGAILAALLTGIFSLVRLVLSKEQKISEARLAWTKSLRTDLSVILAKVETLTRLAEDKLKELKQQKFTDDQLADFRKKHTSIYTGMEEAGILIALRLNPQENKTLLGLLDRLLREFRGDCENISNIYNIHQQAVAESHKVLKTAWRRIKRGEPVFVMTEVLLVVGVLTVVGLTLSWGDDVLRIVPTSPPQSIRK